MQYLCGLESGESNGRFLTLPRWSFSNGIHHSMGEVMHTYFVMMPGGLVMHVNAKNERDARRMVRKDYPKKRLPKGAEFIRVDKGAFE